MKKQKLSILFTSLMMVVLSAAWGCPVGAVPTDADPSDPVRREVMVLESGGGGDIDGPMACSAVFYSDWD